MKKKIIGSPQKQMPVEVKPIHGMHVINPVLIISQSTPVIGTQPIYTPQLITSQSTPIIVTQPIISEPAITKTQVILPKSTVEEQVIASKPVIQAPVIVKQDNSTQLLEEIRLLKGFLQQKDILIEKLYSEKQELSNKLAISETNNSALISQFNELKQDKMDLKIDKANLHYEIQQLKKEFTEIAHNSVIQDLSQIIEHHDNNILQLGNTVQSIDIDNNHSLLANNMQNANNNPFLLADVVNNDNIGIVSLDIPGMLLGGQNSQNADSEFSIIQ